MNKIINLRILNKVCCFWLDFNYIKLFINFIFNLIEIIPTNDIISRNGWTTRSLTKPKSNYKPTRNELMINKYNLNYANLPESNVDIIPFLYTDKITKPTTTNLFNSQYQLTNSNPNRILNQNIAYIQPNSLAPFQPNIVLFPAASYQTPNLTFNNELKKENQSSINSLLVLDENLKTNNNIANQSKPISEFSSITANNNVSSAEISQFDISQIGSNPTDIELENVQNHESLDNIPVVPVQNEIINATTENILNNNLTLSINNSTTTIVSNLPSTSNLNTEQLEKSNSDQPIDFDKNYLISDSPIINPFMKSRQYNTKITPRSHRSLIVDMPSMATYLTAAVAQSGHSIEQRKNLYKSFLNNYN